MSSRGHWFWHPGRGELGYRMVDRRGGVTEGATRFPDATTFTTVATRVGPNGEETLHKDENSAVSPDVHRNESFRRQGDDWVSGGLYVWTREGAAPAAR